MPNWTIELDSEHVSAGDCVSGIVRIPHDTSLPVAIRLTIIGSLELSVQYDDNGTTTFADSDPLNKNNEKLGRRRVSQRGSTPQGTSRSAVSETTTFLRVETEAWPRDSDHLREFPFHIDIPSKSIGSNSAQWYGVSLPPSLELPYGRGKIKYTIETKQPKRKLAGLLPWKSPVSRELILCPAPNIVEPISQTRYSQRAINVSVFDESSLGWMSSLKYAAGFDTSVGAARFLMRMELPDAGFVPGTAIQHGVKITVNPHPSSDITAKQPFEINSFGLGIVTSNFVTVCGHSEMTTKSWHLIKEVSNLAFTLDFGSDGSKTADITALISGAYIPHDVTPSTMVPGLQITHEIRCVLSIQPVAEPRLVTPYYCKLESPLEIIASPSSDGRSVDAPPPYKPTHAQFSSFEKHSSTVRKV